MILASFFKRKKHSKEIAVDFNGETLFIPESKYSEWNNGYILKRVTIEGEPRWFCRCFMCGTYFTIPYDGSGEDIREWDWFRDNIFCPLCEYPRHSSPSSLREVTTAYLGRFGIKAW